LNERLRCGGARLRRLSFHRQSAGLAEICKAKLARHVTGMFTGLQTPVFPASFGTTEVVP
jgi:hypothetical protein